MRLSDTVHTLDELSRASNLERYTQALEVANGMRFVDGFMLWPDDFGDAEWAWRWRDDESNATRVLKCNTDGAARAVLEITANSETVRLPWGHVSSEILMRRFRHRGMSVCEGCGTDVVRQERWNIHVTTHGNFCSACMKKLASVGVGTRSELYK